MITWKKDGAEMQEDVYVGETLPNEDGTFQKKAVLTVSPEERKKGQYTCEVAQRSTAPIVKTLIIEDGKNPSNTTLQCLHRNGTLPCDMPYLAIVVLVIFVK